MKAAATRLKPMVLQSCCSQCCQKFIRAPNHGKLAFLPVANDINVAQFLLSNHAPNFPNLGAFQSENNENHPLGGKNN